jgi:hypothetical protein
MAAVRRRNGRWRPQPRSSPASFRCVASKSRTVAARLAARVVWLFEIGMVAESLAEAVVDGLHGDPPLPVFAHDGVGVDLAPSW